MGNKIKGEVTVDFEGKEYTVLLDFNAFCEAEAKLDGVTALEVLARIEAGKAKATELRIMMWAGLRENHPDITLKQAGRIIGANNGALMTAVMASFGEAEAVEGNGKAAAPAA